MKEPRDGQPKPRISGIPDQVKSDVRVLSLDAARRRRDLLEEQRLEQLVIERWTGRGEADD